MDERKPLPGTAQHQKILRAITSYYEGDPGILAVIVFGSLGRGNWDVYSDIDLDVVIADEARVDVETELISLCASLTAVDEQVALLIPRDDHADVVFQSLMELSIRYHPLANTSPNILDSMLLLSGRIDRSLIELAGAANRTWNEEPLGRELDRCVRYALEVDNALQRGRLWSAMELLHSMRQSLMELFARSHHAKRAYQFFEKEADPKIQVRLGETLPRYDLTSAQAALSQFMNILTHDLGEITGGQVQLTKIHAELFAAIRSRQKTLKL
jgi:predicted nucleotidyltransferase